MQKGLNFDLPVVTAGLLGVITATGGGLLRDLFSGEPPGLLRPGELALTASIIGVFVYALLYELGVPGYIDLWIVLGVVMLLRLASAYFGWTTPEASNVPTVTDVGGTILATPRRIRPSLLRRTGATSPEPGPAEPQIHPQDEG